MSSLRRFVRSVIVGDDQFILSHSQYKRILLTGQLCFITITICVVYIFVDLFNGRPYAWPYQLGCAVIALLSFLLNRNRNFTAAKLLLGLTVNFTIFLFSVSEPVDVGLYMYFIPASLGALVAFGYEERYKAILFGLLSTALFIVSVFVRIPFIPEVSYSDQYIRMNVLMNFIGSGWASVCIIFFVVSINHRWEAALNKNEQEIKQKNIELTALNASLDRFVYSTSHDLRSPLKSMRGLIQLTQMTTELPEVREYVAQMKGQIDHLEKFISSIADYSRNRTQDISTQPVNIKRLLGESLASLRYFPGASELLVNVEVDEGLVLIVDRTRLQVILNNLLSNAIKYRDAEKEKSFVMIRAQFDSGVLTLTIEDNGIGIPETYLTKIFDMYVRVHEQSHGSGLGLYILKETVEKLGGSIKVVSRVQEGTSFIISVPATSSSIDNIDERESLPAS